MTFVAEGKQKIYNSLHFLFIILCFWGFAFCHAQAATLEVTPASGQYHVGDTIKARVTVSSDDTSINAVSGSISFSKDTLNITSISKSASIITLWAQEPKYSNTSGTASFEGVTLNGYQGSGATVVTFYFKVIAEGNGVISIGNSSSVLANDGSGTNVLENKSGAQYTFSAASVTPTPIENTGITVSLVPKENPSDPQTQFTVVAETKKIGLPYSVQIDTGTPIQWQDDGSHLYVTDALLPGSHTIIFTTKDTHGKDISGSATFTINPILKPQITDYQTNNTEGQFLVVKGKADPNTVVTIYVTQVSTDPRLPAIDEGGTTLTSTTTTVLANNAGKFIYVSSNKMNAGVYVITAQSKTTSGSLSEMSDPVKLTVSAPAPKSNLLYYIALGVVAIILILFIIIMLLSRKLYVERERRKNLMSLVNQNQIRNPQSFVSTTPNNANGVSSPIQNIPDSNLPQ